MTEELNQACPTGEKWDELQQTCVDETWRDRARAVFAGGDPGDAEQKATKEYAAKKRFWEGVEDLQKALKKAEASAQASGIPRAAIPTQQSMGFFGQSPAPVQPGLLPFMANPAKRVVPWVNLWGNR